MKAVLLVSLLPCYAVLLPLSSVAKHTQTIVSVDMLIKMISAFFASKSVTALLLVIVPAIALFAYNYIITAELNKDRVTELTQRIDALIESQQIANAAIIDLNNKQQIVKNEYSQINDRLQQISNQIPGVQAYFNSTIPSVVFDELCSADIALCAN